MRNKQKENNSLHYCKFTYILLFCCKTSDCATSSLLFPLLLYFSKPFLNITHTFSYKVQLQSSATAASMFFYCKEESGNFTLFICIWVIPCQLIQNSELFPVHFMDFLKENSCKKKKKRTFIKFMGPCKILQLYPKYLFKL